MTLFVEKIVGAASVQDLGRVSFASHAVPRGGALVRALLRAANAAIGNEDGAACIEIFGRAWFVAERAVRVATEDGAVRALAAGERVVVDPVASLRARYLAIDGGVDAPVVLGSRSAFLGETLRVGDRVDARAASRASRVARAEPFERAGPIRVIVGPDLPEAGERIARARWRVSASSDRKGTRLEPLGARVAQQIPASLPSSPMVAGAIELPPSGDPIVIGPDGPTTGGYALVATIARDDLDRFHARPFGAEVAFQIV